MGILEVVMLIVGTGMLALVTGFELGRICCEFDVREDLTKAEEQLAEVATKALPRCECCHEVHAFNRVNTGLEIRMGKRVLAPAYEAQLCDDCARRVVDYVSVDER